MTPATILSRSLFALALAAPSLAWSQPVAPWGAPPPAAPTPPTYAPQPGYAPQPVYPPQALPTGVPVRFVPNLSGDRFTVTVATPAGPQQCQAPCVMALPMGEHTVSVTGEAEYTDTISVEPYPLHVRIRRYRSERMIWGAAGTGVGVALLIAGLAMVEECTPGAFTTVCERSSASNGLMILGSALAITAATTGFTTMGSNSLVATADFNVYAQRRGPRLAGLGAAPASGGALLGATISF